MPIALGCKIRESQETITPLTTTVGCKLALQVCSILTNIPKLIAS